MKPRWLILLAMGLLLTSCAERPSHHDIIVKFDTPAAVWEECIPLGNGHIGMMPDGDPYHEAITLNDITLWSGAPYDASNPRLYPHSLRYANCCLRDVTMMPNN